MTLASERERTVIFLAEKCASTSVRAYILEHDDSYTRIHGYPAWDSRYTGWVSIGFSRNPYDRAVSYWKYRKEDNQTDKTFADFVLHGGLDILPLNKWYSGIPLTHSIDRQEINRQLPQLLHMSSYPPMLNRSHHGHTMGYYHHRDDVCHAVEQWAGNDFELFGYARMD